MNCATIHPSPQAPSLICLHFSSMIGKQLEYTFRVQTTSAVFTQMLTGLSSVGIAIGITQYQETMVKYITNVSSYTPRHPCIQFITVISLPETSLRELYIKRPSTCHIIKICSHHPLEEEHSSRASGNKHKWQQNKRTKSKSF